MITLPGAASRSVWDKKSFKIVFRDRYGGDVHFDLFGQGITEFHSLNLRGGDSVGMLTYREPPEALRRHWATPSLVEPSAQEALRELTGKPSIPYEFG